MPSVLVRNHIYSTSETLPTGYTYLCWQTKTESNMGAIHETPLLFSTDNNYVDQVDIG